MLLSGWSDGLVRLYAQHLPLYVSADSILHAVHRSYDSILLSMELSAAEQELGQMLEEPLQKRAEKNKAGRNNGLVRLDKVMDLSKTAVMSNTIALGEGVDLESINKGK